MARKKFGRGGIVAGVTSGSEEWEATGRTFKDERGYYFVPCRRVDDHAVTRNLPLATFAKIPKTAMRWHPPVEAGDLSPCGQLCAIRRQFCVDGRTYVECVWLDKPSDIVRMHVHDFRAGKKTAVRHGEEPITFNRKYGSWYVTGYGDLNARGRQLYAGVCTGCGCESRGLWASHLRRNAHHNCLRIRDRSGYTANGFTVVRRQWHEGLVRWVVRNTATDVAELWTPARVEVDLVGDLHALDKECGMAIRAAVFKGEDSDILREIGTTVAEVQRYLPLDQYNRGDQLGHILPRKMFHTPRSRVASWHPRLLRWIAKTKNVQMHSLAWLEKFTEPGVVASSRELLAMWTADMQRLYPDGYYGHLHGRGRITAKRRALFGLPSRDDEVAAWRREAEAFEGLYDGYGILANIEGSEEVGG